MTSGASCASDNLGRAVTMKRTRMAGLWGVVVALLLFARPAPAVADEAVLDDESLESVVEESSVEESAPEEAVTVEADDVTAEEAAVDEPTPLGADIDSAGTCGTCTWTIDTDGLMRIYPSAGTSGTLRRNTAGKAWPWANYVSSVTSVIVDATVYAPSDASEMFKGFNNLVSADLRNMDVLGVTDMSSMFSGCISLTTLDITGWETTNVTDMSYTFSSCRSLTSLDIANWNTSKVTRMSNTFSYCTSLTSLDISGWDTSRVTNMSRTFAGCTSLSTLDLSGWNVSKVTTMQAMFQSCGKLVSADLSNWSMGSVQDMLIMFDGCTSLTTLDTTGWDTSSVTDMGSMFRNCSSLVSLDLSGWDVSSVTSMSTMFNKCTALTSLTTGWKATSLVSTSSMFSGCTSLVTLDASGWGLSSLLYTNSMFNGCSKLATLDTTDWTLSSVTDASDMFFGCSALVTLDASGWDMSSLKKAEHMFMRCGNLESISFANWNTSSLQNMLQMFDGCSSLTTLDFSGWDTSHVYNSGSAFSGCRALAKVIVGTAFNTAYVFPNATAVNEKWWSEADQEWYSVAEIKETRSGIADTYLNVGQKPDTRTVSFAGGGGSGAMEPVVVEFGSTFTLPACEFTAPSGKEFDGWDAGAVGATITVTKDVTLTAQWKNEIPLIPIYRMYNTKTSEHLWTKSKKEYDSCGKGSYVDWRQENIAWYSPNLKAPTSYAESTQGNFVYVWRLYDKGRTGDHIYLTYGAEMKQYLANGWVVDKGAGFWTLKKGTTMNGRTTIPIYRAYNPKLKRGKHHYTPSKVEYDTICKKHGWKPEGVKFYVTKK